MQPPVEHGRNQRRLTTKFNLCDNLWSSCRLLFCQHSQFLSHVFLPLSAHQLALGQEHILLPPHSLPIHHANISTPHPSSKKDIFCSNSKFCTKHCDNLTILKEIDILCLFQSMSNLYFQEFSLAKDIWEDVVEIFQCRFNYVWNIFYCRPDIKEISCVLQEINSFCEHKFCSNSN